MLDFKDCLHLSYYATLRLYSAVGIKAEWNSCKGNYVAAEGARRIQDVTGEMDALIILTIDPIMNNWLNSVVMMCNHSLPVLVLSE